MTSVRYSTSYSMATEMISETQDFFKYVCLTHENNKTSPLITRLMGPTRGPPGADRTVGPMPMNFAIWDVPMRKQPWPQLTSTGWSNFGPKVIVGILPRIQMWGTCEKKLDWWSFIVINTWFISMPASRILWSQCYMMMQCTLIARKYVGVRILWAVIKLGIR